MPKKDKIFKEQIRLAGFYREEGNCHFIVDEHYNKKENRWYYTYCSNKPEEPYYPFCEPHDRLMRAKCGIIYPQEEWFKVWWNSIRSINNRDIGITQIIEHPEGVYVKRPGDKEFIFIHHSPKDRLDYWEALEYDIEKQLDYDIKSDNIPEDKQPEYRTSRYLRLVIYDIEDRFDKKYSLKEFKALPLLTQCYFIKSYIIAKRMGNWFTRLEDYYLILTSQIYTITKEDLAKPDEDMPKAFDKKCQAEYWWIFSNANTGEEFALRMIQLFSKKGAWAKILEHTGKTIRDYWSSDEDFTEILRKLRRISWGIFPTPTKISRQ